MTTTRCVNCGCGIEPGAGQCGACGLVVVGASVGHMASRDFEMSPMPPPKYDVKFGVVETIGATFKLYFDNIGRLFALGLFPQVLTFPLIITSLLPFLGLDIGEQAISRFIDEELGVFIGASAGIAIGIAFLYALAIGAVIHTLNERTQGLAVGPLSAIAASLRHSGWLALAYVAVALIPTLGMAAVIVPGALAIFQSSPMLALGVLPGLGVFALGVWLSLRLVPALPAVVVEDKNVVAALARAWELTRGKSLEILGAVVLTFLVYVVVAMGIGMFTMVPTIALGFPEGQLVGQVIQLIVNAFLFPFMFTFPFAIYAGLVNAESEAQNSHQSQRSQQSQSR